MQKKKHKIYKCKECEIDFVVKAYRYFNLHNPYCPKCGEKMFTEVVKDIWLERPYLHHRKYSQEEDDVIIESRKRGLMVKEIELDGRTVKSIERRLYRLREMGLCK